MARFLTGTTLLALLATLWWLSAGERFETAAPRAALSYESRAHCPLAQDAIRSEDVGMLSLCTTFGLGAYESARRYPAIAGELFGIYGETPEFLEVLERYGHIVLPIVQYFREQDSLEFRIRASMREMWERLQKNEPISRIAVDLTPNDRGYIAVMEIKRRGHGLLGEFEPVGVEVKRKQVTRIIGTTVDIFTGGITDLEAAIVRGEKPTWKQVAYASLDATIVLGGAAAVVKSLQVAKTAGKGAVFAKTGAAVRTLATASKVGAMAGGAVAAYAIALNPSLLLSAAGWVAEQLGGYAWMGVAVLALLGAALVMACVEMLARWIRYLLLPVLFPLRVALRFAHWYRRRHPKPT